MENAWKKRRRMNKKEEKNRSFLGATYYNVFSSFVFIMSNVAESQENKNIKKDT